MVDDTDFPKTERRIENIGRVYSHLRHRTILGFKSLLLGITDGKSQFILDFAILGEKGKKNNFSMSDKELTARALINLLEAGGEGKRSRKLGCQYITAYVRFAGTDVRLYFVKRKKESWNGIVTTNLSLEFLEAYRIYAMHWSLEVFFKETKGLLGMGKCQSRNFTAQLAATTITALQYNLLSLAKRFISYETIGGIFRNVQHAGMELSVRERIWGIILEMVKIMTGIFSIEEEEIFDSIINKSDNLAHFNNFYKLKSAS